MWKTLGTKPLTPEERRHIAEYLYGEREWGDAADRRRAQGQRATPAAGLRTESPVTYPARARVPSLGELNKFSR